MKFFQKNVCSFLHNCKGNYVSNMSHDSSYSLEYIFSNDKELFFKIYGKSSFKSDLKRIFIEEYRKNYDFKYLEMCNAKRLEIKPTPEWYNNKYEIFSTNFKK